MKTLFAVRGTISFVETLMCGWMSGDFSTEVGMTERGVFITTSRDVHSQSS